MKRLSRTVTRIGVGLAMALASFWGRCGHWALGWCWRRHCMWSSVMADDNGTGMQGTVLSGWRYQGPICIGNGLLDRIEHLHWSGMFRVGFRHVQ